MLSLKEIILKPSKIPTDRVRIKVENVEIFRCKYTAFPDVTVTVRSEPTLYDLVTKGYLIARPFGNMTEQYIHYELKYLILKQLKFLK